MNQFFSITKRACMKALIVSNAFVISACGSGPDDPLEPYNSEGRPRNWESISIAQVNTNGTTLPYVVARPSVNRDVHFAWYNANSIPEGPSFHQINHLVWNPVTHVVSQSVVANRPAPSGVNGFDRCDQFDMRLDGDTPILIYPTYETDDFLQQVEADIAVNVYESNGWQESTGAVGFVDRNPVYQDGHITDNMSLKVDGQGNVHFCYQYYTEGMDSANFRYPDLYYVRRDRATLSDPIVDIEQFAQLEELVDGNAFSSFGVHNTVGKYSQLLLDEQDLPVIVYAEHGENFMGTYALKLAFKDKDGQWHREIVDSLPDGWKIGSISAVFYPIDPDDPTKNRPLAIAYAIRLPNPEPDNGHHLLFASNRSGEWTTQMVDESTWCGTHCSLAFTPDGRPAVAYLDERSHSGRIHRFLKYAEFNGLCWNHESAEEYGNVGRYNTLWFNEQGIPHICTFNDTNNEIVVIRQSNG